jgi:hypothetical protein
MKSGLQTYFFLASFAFRSKFLVLIIVKNIWDPRSGIQDPEKIRHGTGPRIQEVKKHRIPDPGSGSATLVALLYACLKEAYKMD